MSTKNFVSYGDAETLFTGVGNKLSALNNYENQNNLNLEVPNRKNLFDKDNADISTGYAINPQTGGTYPTTNRSASNYIKIDPSTTYTLTKVNDSSSVAFYDSKKTYISGASSFGTKTTPSNAKYLRFDYKTENLAIIQLELGSTETSYAPYIPSVESRIEAVESGLDTVKSGLTNVESNLDNVVVEYAGPAHTSDGRYYYFYFSTPFQSTCNRIFFDITYGTQYGYPKNAICMYSTDGSTTAWVNTDDTKITNALTDGELIITVDCGSEAWVIPALRIKKKYGDLLTIH